MVAFRRREGKRERMITRDGRGRARGRQRPLHARYSSVKSLLAFGSPTISVRVLIVCCNYRVGAIGMRPALEQEGQKAPLLAPSSRTQRFSPLKSRLAPLQSSGETLRCP